MSGGHYEYAYHFVNDMAFQIAQEADAVPGWDDSESRKLVEAGERRKIAAFLEKVSEAMRSLEWCDSGDMCWEDTRKQWVELGVLEKEEKVQCPK